MKGWIYLKFGMCSNAVNVFNVIMRAGVCENAQGNVPLEGRLHGREKKGEGNDGC